MAKYPLNEEHKKAHRHIALGDRAIIAIAAHVEVRTVLRDSSELRLHGLSDILIGSYARRVSIWPGKDVDVFGRLSLETTDSISADDAYAMFGRSLVTFEADGRLTSQPRSFKVAFSPEKTPAARSVRTAAQEYGWASRRVESVIDNLERLAFEFSVDVVPAVGWGGHYGIPEIGRHLETGDRYRTGAWRLTNPVALTELTQQRNRDPLVGGSGAFVRVVKVMKQIKCHHLPDTKPSALFYEFILHEGFQGGAISGSSWADITTSALEYIAQRLPSTATRPVCDPVLDQPYMPVPPASDLSRAASLFADLAAYARRAVNTDDRCQAAIEWRKVFGENQQHPSVFPLPTGCRGTGAAMGAAAANLAVGGTAEKSFGDR